MPYVWVYFYDERRSDFHELRIGFMPEVRLIEARDGGSTFDVTQCGECSDPSKVEAFLLSVYDAMKCRPEDAE